jgi:fructoselysine-6-phosphate deglycase
MLNFDEDRFLGIQSGAMALAQGIHEAIATSLRHGAENLFFLGAGGAGILMEPAARLLQLRSRFPVHLEMPAELVVTGSVHLGPHSIAVIPCGPSGTSSAASGSTRSSSPPCRRASPAGCGWTCPTGCSAVSTCRSPHVVSEARRGT